MRAWAPSCRSRSIRCSSAACASTTRRRVTASSVARSARRCRGLCPSSFTASSACALARVPTSHRAGRASRTPRTVSAKRPGTVLNSASTTGGRCGLGTAHNQRGAEDRPEIDDRDHDTGDPGGEPEREQQHQPGEVPPRGGLPGQRAAAGPRVRPGGGLVGSGHRPAQQGTRPPPLQSGEAPGHPREDEEDGRTEVGHRQQAAGQRGDQGPQERGGSDQHAGQQVGQFPGRADDHLEN